MSIFAVPKPLFWDQGEMPEWSIGPHSKCGVRATVPGVRIPLSPLNLKDKMRSNNDKSCKIKVLRDFFFSPLGHPKDTKKTRSDSVSLLNRY